MRTQISVLPQHDPKFLSDHLGYHSLVGDPSSDGTYPPHRIDIKLPWAPALDSVALAPAFDPAGPEGVPYAFPKRFKIEVLNPATGEFEMFVNWLDEDFPDPGPYPVFFSGIDRVANQVRITVPQAVRASGVAYFALGEIYLFRLAEDGGIGANTIVWDNRVMEVSGSLSMPPLWSAEYLHDGVEGFGFPLSDEEVASEDLMITYENGRPRSDKVQIVMDMGLLRPVGRIDFWPAVAPDQLALPAFGLPKTIMVELSTDPGFEMVKTLQINNTGRKMYRDNRLSLTGEGHAAQYVRVTLEGLSEYKGRPILGLGEIMISNNERIWSIDSKVTAQGIPEKDIGQLPRLVDGCSRQRRILSQGEWIKGLAQRRPLDRRLAVVERELAMARAAWRTLQLRLSLWGGPGIALVLVVGMVLQRRQRRKVIDSLRWQIAHDLHDEVGSSLGSISLTAEQLESEASDAAMKADLGDLSLMAREACASLREVVWVIDQATIHLPALIQKLAERAEWVLGGTELTIETPPDCPDTVVSFPFKRHLIMFFKEAVHNCARHAQATRVRIAVEIAGPQLQVTVGDNGRGFDPAELKTGWGLANMKKRAQELGGELDMESHPGRGTTITLRVPLNALPGEPSQTYKTSN